MSEVMSVRAREGTIGKLKLMACRRGLREGREVRWTSLVARAVESLLHEAEGASSSHESASAQVPSRA